MAVMIKIAIKVDAGFRTGNVRLELSSNGLDLIVKLLEAAIGTNEHRDVADSLTVDLQLLRILLRRYYKNYMQGSAVEQTEAVWDSNVLLIHTIHGIDKMH